MQLLGLEREVLNRRVEENCVHRDAQHCCDPYWTEEDTAAVDFSQRENKEEYTLYIKHEKTYRENLNIIYNNRMFT